MIHAETAFVIREHNRAAFTQEALQVGHQAQVIALYIKAILHTLGVGERWRIDEDQIELFIGVTQPAQDISLHQTMLASGQAIETQVALRPLQIGARHIHRSGAARAARPHARWRYRYRKTG